MEERCTGVLEKYNCKVLGTPIETIITTKYREIFSQKLQAVNKQLALSYSAVNIEEEAVECDKKIGCHCSCVGSLVMNIVYTVE